MSVERSDLRLWNLAQVSTVALLAVDSPMMRDLYAIVGLLEYISLRLVVASKRVICPTCAARVGTICFVRSHLYMRKSKRIAGSSLRSTGRS